MKRGNKFIFVLFIFIIFSCMTIEDYWNMAEEAVFDGNYSSAIKWYTKAIDNFNDEYSKIVSYQERGKIYAKQGALSDAIQDFSKVITLGDNSGYLDRANIYIELKEYDKAILDCGAYINKNSDVPIGYTRRGDIYYINNEIDKARNDYDLAFSLFNNITLNNPLMDYSPFEAWKRMVINYRQYFKDEPPMDNQTKLVIQQQRFGNIIIRSFNGRSVNWQNQYVSVPSIGFHSFELEYIIDRVMTNQNPLTWRITENQQTRHRQGGETTITTNRQSLIIFADNVRLVPGHIYIFIITTDDNNEVEFDIKDITSEEGL
jgi:tetratricopeptide (TPR) repeat protein